MYSSGDRGSPVKSAYDATNVKNFTAKFNIEKYLEARATASEHGMTYTILRPVTFFENHTSDMHGKGFTRMWQQVGEKPLQMVSTRDIDWFAGQAFLHVDEYRNRALSLAGDELTQKNAAKIFKEIVGEEMEMTPCVVGKVLKFAMSDSLGAMFAWFKEVGYGADVQSCRKAHPGMQDYRMWLEKSSRFGKK